MKITMLGISRSGKTSYYGSLLNELYKNENGVNGFYIKGRDDIEEKKIAKIYDKIGHPLHAIFPEFPVGTVNVNSLTLPLYKDGRLILTFDFIDYAGGDLAKIDCGEKMIEQLTTAIELSDVSIVLVDAILLSMYQEDIKMAREKLGVNTIISVLLKAKRELLSSGKRIKVIFMLTKTDVMGISGEIPYLKDRILQLYQDLFIQSIISRNDYAIFDVAVAGKGNVETTILREENGGFQIINAITNTPNGKNIVSVLAKAILFAYENITYNISEISHILEEKRRRYNWFMKLIDLLFGGRRHRDIHELECRLEDNRIELRNLSASNTIINELKTLADSKK